MANPRFSPSCLSLARSRHNTMDCDAAALRAYRASLADAAAAARLDDDWDKVSA